MPFCSIFSCCDPNTTRRKLSVDAEKRHARLTAVLEDNESGNEQANRYVSLPTPLRYNNSLRQNHIQNDYQQVRISPEVAYRSSNEESRPSYDTQDTLPAYADTVQHPLLLRSDFLPDDKQPHQAQPTSTSSAQPPQDNNSSQPESRSQTPMPHTTTPFDINTLPPRNQTSTPIPDPYNYQPVPRYFCPGIDPAPTIISDRSSIISIPSTHLTDLTTIEINHTGRTSLSSSYTPQTQENLASIPRPPSIPTQTGNGRRNCPFSQRRADSIVASPTNTESGMAALLQANSQPPSYAESGGFDTARNGVRIGNEELEDHPVMSHDWLQRLRSAAKRDRTNSHSRRET